MGGGSWFLPPDFTFLPDGQIALGRIIPEPERPTATLASLSDHPAIVLPEIKSIVETNHYFSTGEDQSLGVSLFTKLLEIASASAKTDISRHKNKSFSAVDHKVQSYNGPFTKETLKAIVELDDVKKHINSSRFGRRWVYVITGLRVAPQSFTVGEERGGKTAVDVSASALVPAGGAPIEQGGTLTLATEETTKKGYGTAAGIVFAYRLHVIRPKGSNPEAELFSDKAAFFSGQVEEEEEIEAAEVNLEILRQDLDLQPDSYREEQIVENGAKQSFIIAKF